MACKICGRSSCTSSFHSIEEQEAFAARQEMSSDVDELRCVIQDLNEECASLRNDTIEEVNGILNSVDIQDPHTVSQAIDDIQALKEE